MTEAGRITALIDGDISGLKTALGQARSEATSAVSGIEGSFKGSLGAGLKDSMSGIASSMGPIGGALSAIGPAGIAAGAGIAVVGGAISSSVAVAGQFQQTMSGVAAVAGATAPQLELMATAARDAGASSVFSASQAAEAMGFLASSGMSVSDTIATLEPTLLMAAAGGLGLAEAGDLMAGSLAQFGLAAGDATVVADTLAAGAAASNASVTQLGQGLQNVGPMAASVGMSLQETTAALGVFANSNIKGAEAGTALKSMIASLLGPTKGAAAAFAEMGISADQVNPTLHSYDEIMSTLKGSHMTAQQAVAIFGKEMAANALVAVNGADSYDELLTKVSETGKASEMATTQTDNYKGAMDEFGGAVEEAQIALGNVFLPVLTNVVQGLTVGVTAVTEFGKALGDMVQGGAALLGELFDPENWMSTPKEFVENLDDAFLSALGIDIGNTVGDAVAEDSDLPKAPGEALGSPEALAGAGDAGKDIAAAVFDPEAWQLEANDAIITSMKAAGAGVARADWKKDLGEIIGLTTSNGVEISSTIGGDKSHSYVILKTPGGAEFKKEYYASGYTREQALHDLVMENKNALGLDEIGTMELEGLYDQADLLKIKAGLKVEVETKLDLFQIVEPQTFLEDQASALGSALVAAMKDGVIKGSEGDDLLGLARSLESWGRIYPEEYGKLAGSDYIQAMIDAVEAGDFKGAMAALGQIAGADMGAAAGEAASEALASKLQDGTGMFYGDLQTKVHDWTEYVTPEGGYVGPTEYYDDYYAQKAGQIERAAESLKNIEDIRIGAELDTTKIDAAIKGFSDDLKVFPMDIDSAEAEKVLLRMDATIETARVKPVIVDGSAAMAVIAQIDAAAGRTITKTIMAQVLYGYGSSFGGGDDNWLSFANEGYVRSPTLAVIGDRPGGEYVVGAARFEAAAAQMRSGGGAPQITINYSPVINGAGLSQDELSRVLEEHDEKLVNKIIEAKEWG